jgi:hypothetical protein
MKICYSFINGSTALCWALASFQFRNLFCTQTVGLLGRVEALACIGKLWPVKPIIDQLTNFMELSPS